MKKKTHEDLLSEINELKTRLKESEGLTSALETALEDTKAQTSRITAITHAFPALIFIMNREGRYIDIITEQRDLLYGSAEELLGKTLHEIFDEQMADEFLKTIHNALDTGKTTSMEYVLGVPMGNRVFEAQAAPIIYNGEITSEVLFLVRDITHRKEAEYAIRESEARFRQLTENISEVYMLIDVDTKKLLYINDGFERIWGYNKEILKEKSGKFFDFIHPEDQEEVKSRFTNTVFDKEYEQDYRIITKDGNTRWITTRIYPIRNEDGEFYRLGSVSNDITERKLAEKALEKSDEQFRQLTDNIEELFVLIDFDSNKVIYLSRGFEEVFGIPFELLEKTDFDFTEFIHPDDMSEVGKLIIGSGEDEVNFAEYRIVLPDGEIRWMSTRTFPVKDDDGKLYRIASITSNITKRKLSENALKTSEERFRQLTESISEVYMLIDFETKKLLYISDAFEKVWGFSRETLKKKRRAFFDYIHPDDHDKVMDQLTIADGENEIEAEYRIIRKDGDIRWVHTLMHPIKDDRGKTYRFRGISTDITEQKQNEQNIRESEERFRQLAETMSDVLWLVDVSSNQIIYANPSFETVWGAKPDDLINNRDLLSNSVLEDDKAGFFAALMKHNDGEMMDHVYRIRRPDGDIRWVNTRTFPINNDAGEFYRISAITTDITENRIAEEANQTAADIVREIPSGLFIYQFTPPDNLILIKGNPEAQKLTSISLDKWVGKEFNEIWPEAKDAGLTDNLLEVVKTGIPYEVEDKFYEDEHISGIYRIKGFSMPGGKLGVAFEDITEIKKILQAEEEQRILATALVETAEKMNKTLDFDGVLDMIMALFEDLVPHGGANIMLLEDDKQTLRVARACKCYEDNALIRPTPEISYTMNELSHLLEIMEGGEAVIINDTKSYPQWVEHAQGKNINAYMGMSIQVDGEIIGLLSADSSEIGFFTEKHAQRMKAFANQAAIALRNAMLYKQLENYSENLEQAVGERTSELERMNEKLQELSNLKDEFVANVSHELNTPVTSLKVQMHLLTMNKEGLPRYLPTMQRETERLEHTIQSLLHLTRLDQGQQKWEFGPMSLNQLIKQFVEDRKMVAEHEGLDVKMYLTPDLPIIQADGGLLGQVIEILFSNAMHYSPPGGHIIISTVQREKDDKQWVGFRIKDTGQGITPEEQRKLFERFYRGKIGYESGKPGTGLGLAIAREIVEGHQGEIEMQSEGIPGKGSAFIVWLPVKN